MDGASDFRMLSRKAVDAILRLTEYCRFSKGIFGWIGFRTKWIPYENAERIAGETKWSFRKLFCYALAGITAFSTTPLELASFAGILSCVLAFWIPFWRFLRAMIWGYPMEVDIAYCSILFMGGLQLLCMGIIGRYLANVYMETKKRPIYIIGETNLQEGIKR